MPEIAGTAVTKIYENTNLTVKARIDKRDVASIEDVTFKFLKDGEQFEEKTIPISEGRDSGDHKTVSHAVQAPAVPDDKDRYFLDYHYFYKVKNAANTESLQNFPSSRIQVFPRVAQLKVTDKDGKPFHGFQFRVEQNGELSEVRKTFANDTVNAKGETVPAGSCEFNLGLFTGFRIVPSAPYEITEEVVTTGRKREIKGDVSFRAAFVAPEKGNRRQFVNNEVENLGQTGIGHEVTVEVGIDPEDLDSVADKGAAEVHFRVTFGPGDTDPAPKSKRNDASHPTKVLKVSDSDTNATIEEKEAGKKYEGKVTLKGGKFKVALGKAGGDTCKIEISGSARFLTNTAISPDAVLQFENWRRVYYELMVPDIMQGRVLDAAGEEGAQRNLSSPILQRMETLSRQLFVEFVLATTHVFKAFEESDYGTLAPKSFLGDSREQDGTAYILSGRNWRKLPKNQAWQDKDPAKTLKVIICDALLKFRIDTADAQKGTNDFSGSLTEAAGFVDIEEKFGGKFMPFSGLDGEESISKIKWTADISKDDAVCKYTPALVIADSRHADQSSDELTVTVTADDQRFPDMAEPIVFPRPPYPLLELEDMTQPAAASDADDGKVTVKEPVLGKEMTLTFDLSGDGMVTSGQQDQLDSFFKTMFTDGKEKLVSGSDTNKFHVEIHGKSGDGRRTERIEIVTSEISAAYERTFEHAVHMFKPDLSDADVNEIQFFVDDLLVDTVLLHDVDAKVAVHISCPSSTNHGEDDCFNAVKNKLQELFDATKVDFAYHPGLNEHAEPRSGTFTLADITDVLNDNIETKKSTIKQWHFQLPDILSDRTPGPGSFIGAEKTHEKCPVKIEFSVQAHEMSTGEHQGSLLALPKSSNWAEEFYPQQMLRGFFAGKDEASLKHGHNGQGNPGDCLADGGTLCAACIDFGRSKDLSVIGMTAAT